MRHSPLLRTRLLQACLLAWPLSLMAPAQATDSAAASAAIARLLAQPLPGSDAQTQAHPPESGTKNTIKVLRGENLDRVIRRAWPNQPFKDEFVRKAFVQLNADALGKNPARVLPAGTVLNVPGPQDLMTQLADQYPALAKSTAHAHDDTASAPASPKRRWVQFP